MRGRRVIAVTALAWTTGVLAWGFEFPFQNPDLPAEERITDLIGRMTLEEKIDCMANRAAVPRLGVVGSPHIEGYHGVAQGGPSNWGRRNPTPTTQFPQAYGLGATWDPELVRRVAAQEAQEARYLFQSAKYNRSGLIVRAPNADLARDPRWGRTEEVYGEDPFLVGHPRDRLHPRPAGRRPALLEDRRAPEALPRQQQRGRPQLARRRTSTSACGASTTRSRSRWRCARAARAR